MLKHENVMRVVALWREMRVVCGPSTVSVTLHDVDVDDVKDSDGCAWARDYILHNGRNIKTARLVSSGDGGHYGDVSVIGPDA